MRRISRKAVVDDFSRGALVKARRFDDSSSRRAPAATAAVDAGRGCAAGEEESCLMRV